jgi:hypothetical protein
VSLWRRHAHDRVPFLESKSNASSALPTVCSQRWCPYHCVTAEAEDDGRFPLLCPRQTPRHAFAETMNEMRMWIDEIQLSEFKIMPTETGIAFDLRFPNKHHASLFQQKFA